MKLTLVIEGSTGSQLVQKIIRLMQRQKLAEIIEEPQVKANIEGCMNAPAYYRRDSPAGACDGGVIYFDLVITASKATTNLFRTIYFPIRRIRFPFPPRVSAPKCRGIESLVREPLRHNLATICERYAGRPSKVGAISFPIGQWWKRGGAAEIRESSRGKWRRVVSWQTGTGFGFSKTG